jgi:RNA polymerase sigma factor (sigma-70 family)
VGKNEQAFEDLVRRYGPMVYGVCLRVLGHHQDAEDTFQATFLMLVRKGNSIRRRKSISAWLYRVAYRLALTQRARSKNRVPEPLNEFLGAIEPVDPAWLELRSALDEEVQRLPGHYRSVLVLCALEGKSYDDAASQLGCPRGTVAVRLLRAREMLKKRLVRRGLIGAATALAAQNALPHAMANVPPALVMSTSSAACAVASGASLDVAPMGAAALVRAATRRYLRERCQVVAFVAAAVGIIGAGFSSEVFSRNAGSGAQSPPFVQSSNQNLASTAFPAANPRVPPQPKPAAPLNGPANKWHLNPTTP